MTMGGAHGNGGAQHVALGEMWMPFLGATSPSMLKQQLSACIFKFVQGSSLGVSNGHRVETQSRQDVLTSDLTLCLPSEVCPQDRKTERRGEKGFECKSLSDQMSSGYHKNLPKLPD